MKLNFMLVVVVLLLLAGCSAGSFHSAEELTKFIADEDNGLIQKATMNGFAITVSYRPTDLLISQEAGESELDSTTFKDLQKKYSGYYYFILSLSRNDKEALHQAEGGMAQYSELVQTLSFRMNEYVNMTTTSQDTIPVGDFMLNRTYGLSQSTDLLFVFNKEKSKDKDWVQFNLNEFGLGIGNQRFRFRTRDLEEVPKIEFAIVP